MNLDKKSAEGEGSRMHKLMEELYPICRSITGNGVRKSLEIIQKHIPLQIHEVPSGTGVFDWIVPKEWNIKDAYIKDSSGNRIVDFNKSNLHVLNYSIPINKKMPLSELKEHLHTLPDYPEWIPYLTSYYHENWGFCLTHKQYETLKEDIYEVVIDSTLEDGNLIYGEFFIKGESKKEILFTTYLCHPSLCNDNLSGPVLLAFLAKHLKDTDPKYSYRFLFIPETIGAITWLSLNGDKVLNISQGMVVTCVGDEGKFTYQKTKNEETELNKAVVRVFQEADIPLNLKGFAPESDERQFSSPGFQIPMGNLMRTPYARFPEYHTSADNLEFVKAECLQESLQKYLEIVFILDNNATYKSLNPKCEPQLGKRGLYRKLGSQKSNEAVATAMLWLLLLSDGKHSLLDVSLRSGFAFAHIREAADLLLSSSLLEEKTD